MATAWYSPGKNFKGFDMAKSKVITKKLEKLIDKKSYHLSKAQALSDMGMEETARPLWATAARLEEEIAPYLEKLGRHNEAALHRISAASCFDSAGEFSRAANLYRAALSGPLRDDVRRDVEKMLATCLSHLSEPVVV